MNQRDPRPIHQLSPLLATAALLLLATPAEAHFGGGTGEAAASVQVPVWVLWVIGAGVVALSFAVVGGFLTAHRAEGSGRLVRPGPPRAAPLGRWAPVLQAQALGVLLFVGLHGLVPGLVPWLPEVTLWLVLWSGLPLLAYALVDPWPVLSPLRALVPVADKLSTRLPRLTYPARLGTWPATLLLLGMIGFEVWGQASRDPVVLGRLVLAYLGVTLAGMSLFGSRTWLARAEVLERAFAWWGTVAPLHRDEHGWTLTWPGARLHRHAARDASAAGFVVALLYGVNFDGFLATGLGQATLAPLGALGEAGAFVATLLLGYLAFLAIFWACMAALRAVSESLEPLAEIGARFAVALVPIAAGYHLAHNLFYLLGQAGVAVPAGWTPWIVGAEMVLIVAAHVVAVVVAHRASLATFPSRLQALKGELPLTAVMVLYTMVGLWIVSLGGSGGLL